MGIYSQENAYDLHIFFSHTVILLVYFPSHIFNESNVMLALIFNKYLDINVQIDKIYLS